MSNALLVFIKNAEKGKVKTRLAATVGDDQALKIYLALMNHTRKIAEAVDCTRMVFYSQWIEKKDNWSAEKFDKRLQKGTDLGVRMQFAFRFRFKLTFLRFYYLCRPMITCERCCAVAALQPPRLASPRLASPRHPPPRLAPTPSAAPIFL